MPSPWSIKGIPQEARAAAKAAAQRHGMTLGAWLVSKIEEEALGSAGPAAPQPAGPAPSTAAATPAHSVPAADATLQALAQMMTRQEAGASESAAIVSLSARIDALSEVVGGLSNTVARSLRTIEECAQSAQASDALAKGAAETAEAARRESALSIRASAAVAEKAVAALGGVASPGEDILEAVEARIEERVGAIESRINAAEEDGAGQLGELAATVARMEKMLEALTAGGAAPALAAPAAAESEPPQETPAREPAAETAAVGAFDLPETGELRPVSAHPGDFTVAPIEAPRLRERIRNRLKAGDFVDENLRAADEPNWGAEGDAEAGEERLGHAETDPQREDPHSGVFGLGGWFRRRPAAPHALEEADLSRIGYEEVFPEEAGRLGAQDASEADFEDSETESDTDEVESRADDFRESDEEVFDLVDPFAEPGADKTSRSLGRDVDDELEDELGDDFDEGDDEGGEDELEPWRADGDEPARGRLDASDDSLNGGFDAAIERARRAREQFAIEEEAEAARLAEDPLRRYGRALFRDPHGDDAPPASFGAADPFIDPDLSDEEPLDLDAAHALPSRPAPEPRRDDNPHGAHGWPGPEYEDEEDDFDAAPASNAGPRGSRETRAESVGRGRADRSVVSSEIWPFETDLSFDETASDAMRDEAGSVRYGVAMSLALMALTAGAAMAALYQLGA